MPKLFVLCGELSGDQHAEPIVKELLEQYPDLEIEGILGPKLRKLPIKEFMPMEAFCLMGFVEIIKKLPQVYLQYRTILSHLLKSQPDGILFVDYPGLNLKLAKSLRKKGYKGRLMQFVCPQVWAWKKGRIHTLESNLDLLMCILPFEPSLFKKKGSFQVCYVGNPSFEHHTKQLPPPDWRAKLPTDKTLIGVFPGSRQRDIEHNFPKMLQAFEKISNPKLIFGISIASSDLKEKIKTLCQNTSLTIGKQLFLIEPCQTASLMKNCYLAVAKSGTNNLELGLFKKAAIVVYHVSSFNYFIAKYLVKIQLNNFSLVNILLKKEVYPELIYKDFSPEKLSQWLQHLLENKEKYQAIQQDCQKLDAVLGEKKCSQEATKKIAATLCLKKDMTT